MSSTLLTSYTLDLIMTTGLQLNKKWKITLNVKLSNYVKIRMKNFRIAKTSTPKK